MSANKQHQQDLIVLGRAIQQVRTQQGVSTGELAIATGIERRRIDALEGGQLDPSYELLLALAEGLDVRPSRFVIHAEELGERDES